MKQHRKSLLSIIAELDRWQRLYAELDDQDISSSARNTLIRLSDRLAVQSVNDPKADPIRSAAGLWLCPACGEAYNTELMADECRTNHTKREIKELTGI